MKSDDFSGEKPACDLVMKGGIASDVVLPLAIVELAKKYRFKRLGGASSGALAAAIAAAAEYAREEGGFQRLAEIPKETAEKGLFYQFQPEPQLSPLFNMLTAPMGKKGVAQWFGFIFAAVAGYPKATLAGHLPGLAIVGFALVAVTLDWLTYGWPFFGWFLFGLLLAAVGATALLGRRVARAITEELTEANFGLCSGKTLKGIDPAVTPAITDWLAEKIDWVAGNVEGGRPLSFGDLKTKGRSIELAIITTDLGTKRPYRLPFREKGHYFSKADFDTLFPERVVKYMCEKTQPLKVNFCWKDCPDDLYPFPAEEGLPIVVAARMSLSFPFLIQQVPLYKCDETLESGSDQPRKCLFSDGGITNNLPIHFFDSLWPNIPTFGISFDEFSQERHLAGENEIRVEMARDSARSALPIFPITGFGAFLARLAETATSWQDNLQTMLPGYRERIVYVHLKPDEGGLNLKMRPAVIRELTQIGMDAGALIAGASFNMDEHRWRRFLIAMAEIEQLLDELAKSHDVSPVPGESFGAFLDRYESEGSYRKKNEDWKRETLGRARRLVALGKEWRKDPTVSTGNIPKPDCDFRIVPKQ